MVLSLSSEKSRMTGTKPHAPKSPSPIVVPNATHCAVVTLAEGARVGPAKVPALKRVEYGAEHYERDHYSDDRQKDRYHHVVEY